MFDPTYPATNALIESAPLRAQLNGLKDLIDAIPAGPQGPPGADGPQGPPVILEDRLDRKARRVPTATMVRLDRPGPMGLLDHKAHPEPMDSREGLRVRKGRKARPAWMALKGRLERMAPKVRRGGDERRAQCRHRRNQRQQQRRGLAGAGGERSTPTQSEVQAIAQKLDELINALRR